MLLCLGVALPPLTRSVLALGVVLLLFGAAYGGINVAFNSAAVDLVAALGRPVIPGFHAAFSLGGMLLGPPAIGFMADRFSLPAALTGMAVLAAVATAIATRHVHAD